MQNLAHRPLARTTLADLAFEALLEQIVTGVLPTGTALNSVAVAKKLEVSRTPVQEALLRLEAIGLVESPSGRQAKVAQFSADDIREVYAVRALLEGAAAESAATNLTDSQLRELRRGADELSADRDQQDWAPRALEYDIHFHDTVAKACRNSRLYADIARYRLLVRAFCRMTATRANLVAAFDEHLHILAAFEARDPCHAQQSMVAHIECRLQSTLNFLSNESISG